MNGAAWAMVFGVCLSFGFQTPAFAQACRDLFQSETDARQTTRERKAHVTIDLVTKQERVESFVAIRGGRDLYVDYLKPAPGKPIIVLLNGLTYRTGIWDAFVEQLKGEGLGILRYDPMGMGETMKKYGPPSGPITLTEQAKDLNSLLNALDIRQKVHVLGLSYGGGLAIEFAAMHPTKIATVMPMSAYTAPIKGQVDQILSQIAATRMMFPYNKATDEELYSFFLRQIVYTTYPMSEPIVLEHPYKLESVYRLAEGATKFRAEEFVDKLPKGSVHQIDAAKDEYITKDVPQRFWDALPAQARGSRMILDHAGHKIPENFPHFSAEWVKLVIAHDARLQKGATWIGGVWVGGVKSGTGKIDIK